MKTRGSGRWVLAAALVLQGCAALQPEPTPVQPPPQEVKPQSTPAPPEPTPEPPAEPVPPPAPSRSPWAERQERKAREREEVGDFAQALTHWKILQLLEPEEARWPQRVRELTHQIDERVASFLRKGEVAARAGDTKAAVDAYVRALALNPQERVAPQRLRELEIEDIRAREQAKLDKNGKKARPTDIQAQPQPAMDSQATYYLETGLELYRQGELEKSIVELEKYLDSFPDDRRARKTLVEAHLRLGQTALKAGATARAMRHFDEIKKNGGADTPGAAALLQQTKKRLADELYNQGVRQSRVDLRKAIDHWKEALTHDPSHVGAKTQLDKAIRMQERLRTIQ